MLMDKRNPRFESGRVLVVGDAMLDRYWHGDANGVCAEAPVPVVRVLELEDRPGGAANVALNVRSLGTQAVLVGVLGRDDPGDILLTKLAAAGIDCDFLQDERFSTITKLRIIAKSQQLVRADFEEPVGGEGIDVLRRMKSHLDKVDMLILSDYDKGVLSAPETMIAAARRAKVPVLVDPKFKDYGRYRGAAVIKPNRAELEYVIGHWTSEAEMVSRCQQLMARHSIGAMLVTRGEQGMTLIQPEQPELHVPAHAREIEVFDRQGAGDTVIAVLAAAMSAGETLVDAVGFASLAASMVVTRRGTASISGPELLGAAQVEPAMGRGILSQEQLEIAVAEARRCGERIVFTNGCFDILHAGHVDYLAEASRLGSRLIVAVNSDASVARLKGAGRPINQVHRRMKILAGLESVDWVVSFDEDTPEALISRIQPDMLVKGGDYRIHQVVGADIVRRYNGEVRVLKYIEDCSTTDLVRKIQSL